MKSVVYEKSFAFAIRIVNLYKMLETEHHEYILSKQVLRSGTSVGANIKEALYAQSKKDFIHKMSIALKEAAETSYWIDLLKETKYLKEREYQSLEKDIVEIIKILTSTIKTSKDSLVNS